MKSDSITHACGFALIELLVVIAIISMLSSIAIPNYAVNREQARTATCLANRKTLETDEAGYYAQHNSPSLTISDTYQCPSDGVYLWLVSDPDDPDYPSVACSIHFAGSLGTPAEELDKLIDYVRNLNLPDNVEKALMERLEMTERRVDRGKTKNLKNAIRSLNWFKNRIKHNRKQIDDAEEIYLKSKADELQEAIRELI